MTTDPLSGDPNSIKRLAQQLTNRSRSIEAGARKATRASNTADGWSGESKQRFTATAATLPDAATRIRGRVDAAATVLNTYADQVRQIQDEAQRIQTAQKNNAEDIAHNASSVKKASKAARADDASDSDRAALRRLESSGDDLSSTQARLSAQWTELVARRQSADRTAASGLSGETVIGNTVSYAASMPGMSDKDFLAALTTMAPEQLAALHKQIESRLATMAPDVVQEWWNSMGGRGTAGKHSAAQDALITALPATIGNLNGVAYWARDQANRISAQRAYSGAAADLADGKKVLAGAIGRSATAAAEREVQAAQKRLDALKNFLAGARTPLATGVDLPRQVVSFSAGPPPLGAVSVGDLDTADNVSYLIPGMGTSLQDTTILMRAGSNVIAAQRQMAGGDNTALVSWIGYDAPPDFTKTGDPSVFLNSDAASGAQKLANDLEGLRHTRPDVTLNVIAHSYGSTTASLALHEAADLGVNSFVTLGSAGIPRQVPDAAATHAAHMYAAQADERWNVAEIGRKMSYPERADPNEGFGATSIDAGSVDGSPRVNVHDMFVNPSADPGGDHGYLDADTNSLLETAKATLR
ncbi:alpha/beta hydrolase [Curtobacterium sp. NPDC090217]|uniref:alpha/beta hydrolase n=1 Tax=Curtobacterium sp. NPDC090217 TaxID=3363970 RepID=UPI0038103C97